MDSLCTIYHQTPNLQGELRRVSEDLDSQLRNLGRVHDT